MVRICLKFTVLLFTLLLAFPHTAFCVGEARCVRFSGEGFPLSSHGKSAPLYASAQDFPGVLRMMKLFRRDIEAVTGAAPEILTDAAPSGKEIVLVGTLGKNPLIDALVRSGRVSAKGVTGTWETFLIQTVKKPFPGVDRALVIAGSDKRGTIYGMFTLSEQMGVSPWYWWADVPAKHRDQILVDAGRHGEGPPSVKYRGIFLNDEYPDLTRWVNAKYGDVQPRENPPQPPPVSHKRHQI